MKPLDSGEGIGTPLVPPSRFIAAALPHLPDYRSSGAFPLYIIMYVDYTIYYNIFYALLLYHNILILSSIFSKIKSIDKSK